MAPPESLRSVVPDGAKFGGGCWRLVGLWPHPEPLTVFGGSKGFRVFFPRVGG